MNISIYYAACTSTVYHIAVASVIRLMTRSKRVNEPSGGPPAYSGISGNGSSHFLSSSSFSAPSPNGELSEKFLVQARRRARRRRICE
ncbi:hypothetical protein Trydic_g1464 [Trypoxylus dichotomus]